MHGDHAIPLSLLAVAIVESLLRPYLTWFRGRRHFRLDFGVTSGSGLNENWTSQPNWNSLLLENQGRGDVPHVSREDGM